MGDQNPTTATVSDQREETIAIDPDFQSSATEDSEKKPMGFFDRLKKPKENTSKEGSESENEEETDEKKKEDPGLGNLIRIFSYGTRFDYFLQFIGALASIATGVTFPLMTIVFGALITDFTEYFSPNSTTSPADFRRGVDRMCLYFVYLFIGKFVLGFIAIACFRLSGIRISGAIRLDYLTSIFRQDLAYFDALSTKCVQETSVDISGTASLDPTPTENAAAGTPGAVAVSITTLSNTIQLGITEKLSLFLQYVAMLVTGFVIAFIKDWRLTLVTICILPATVLIYGISIPIEVKLEKRVLAAQAKAAELAEEVLGSIRTIKSFNAEKRLVARYEKLLEEGKREGLKKAPNSGVQYAGAFFVIYCGYSLCFWYGLRLFQEGKLPDIGTIITVFFAVLIAVMCFGNIAPPVQAMTKAASASGTIFEVVDRQPIIDATSPSGLKPSTVPPGDLELKNVKFSYPGGGEREKVVILGPSKDGGDEADSEGISLAFPEGQTTAIVGRSGSGKSTIVGLIERWYDPQQGSILIGGVDIKELNLRWWRGKIGLVMQEPFLFNDSIYKNVAYGLIGTEWEDAPEEEKRQMVREACIEANAGSFVDELPEGYNTKVGESGVKLSGGQKQRIAIARSIISKPPILILDEATSAIDPRNERIVQDALDRISKGRTTITIAHRLSTVKKADRIVVLGNGHVLEVGTHEELLTRPDGAYTRLVTGQTLLMEDEENVVSDDEDVDVVKLEEEDAADTMEALGRTTTWRSKLSIGKGKNSKVDDVEAAHPEKTEELGAFRCISFMIWEQRKLWVLYLIGLIGAFGAAAAFPVQSILMAKFIEIFQYTYDMDDLVRRGNFWALMFLVLALCVGFFYCLMGSTFTLIQYHLTTSYRLEYFQNVVRQGIPFFDDEGNSAGSLTSRLNSDPTALQNLLGTNTGMMTVSFGNVLGCSILGLVVGWKLALVCICAALPFMFFAGVVRIRIEVKFATSTAAVFADSAQFASEAVGAYRTVSSLIMERSVGERYRKLLADHVKQSFRTSLFSAMVLSGSESMNLLASALCFWYGGRLMSTREYEPYQFFVVYMAIIQCGEIAGQFFGFSPDIAQASQAANRILGIREKSPPPPGEAMDHDGEGGYEVEFRNVDFEYASRDTPVFRDLSLKIEKNQFAAFVGASGCGKTTTISLLERFYSVSGGEILVNGKNLESLDIESYRDVVSLVAQEPTLYQGTIAENVRLGAKDENVSHEAVIQACKEAHIHDFISSLPDGYETICGARGVGLSGGQKQRIAIARALIRNPRILLLDEATASLDSESEKIVQQAFENAAQGRTMIAVAHRLSTVQKADVIFVFDEGRVVEKGSHAALIKKKGTYFQMCQAQALDH